MYLVHFKNRITSRPVPIIRSTSWTAYHRTILASTTCWLTAWSPNILSFSPANPPRFLETPHPPPNLAWHWSKSTSWRGRSFGPIPTALPFWGRSCSRQCKSGPPGFPQWPCDSRSAVPQKISCYCYRKWVWRHRCLWGASSKWCGIVPGQPCRSTRTERASVSCTSSRSWRSWVPCLCSWRRCSGLAVWSFQPGLCLGGWFCMGERGFLRPPDLNYSALPNIW